MITDFSDVEFMTGKEKQTVLNQWKLFIKNDFKPQYFKRALYNHLIQHCSFIAHYDLQGFYSSYFNNPNDTIRFLTQFDTSKDRCRSIEYGSTYWVERNEYSDINVAMCQYFSGLPNKDEIYKTLSLKEESNDLEIAKFLLRKHGREVNF